MKKLAIAALAAGSLVGATVHSANAAEPVTYTGPCATQQALFEKYNIEIDMYAPAVSYAYGTVCRTTG